MLKLHTRKEKISDKNNGKNEVFLDTRLINRAPNRFTVFILTVVLD